MSHLSIRRSFLGFVNSLTERGTPNNDHPVYVFDLTAIRSRLARYSEAAAEHNVVVLMAAKAFCHPKIYATCGRLLGGFDISNHGEFTDVSPFVQRKVLSVTGPSVDLANLQEWQAAGAEVLVNVSDETQLRQAFAFPNLRFGVRICARQDGSRFGILSEDIGRLAPRSRIRGLHAHRGGRSNTISDYVELAQQLLRLAEEHHLDLEYLNVGGGIGANVDFADLLQNLRHVIPSSIRLIIEPGDYFFHATGVLVARVLRASAAPHSQVVLSCSKECHLKWSAPCLLLPNQLERTPEPVPFYGSTCYEKDIIGYFPVRIDPTIHPRIALGLVSSYSISWNHRFNGIPRAELVFYED